MTAEKTKAQTKAGGKPTHRLRFLNKQTEERGTIGAGWQNADGSITIVLDPMVVVRQEAAVLLTLFPTE